MIQMIETSPQLPQILIQIAIPAMAQTGGRPNFVNDCFEYRRAFRWASDHDGHM